MVSCWPSVVVVSPVAAATRAADVCNGLLQHAAVLLLWIPVRQNCNQRCSRLRDDLQNISTRCHRCPQQVAHDKRPFSAGHGLQHVSQGSSSGAYAKAHAARLTYRRPSYTFLELLRGKTVYVVVCLDHAQGLRLMAEQEAPCSWYSRSAVAVRIVCFDHHASGQPL